MWDVSWLTLGPAALFWECHVLTTPLPLYPASESLSGSIGMCVRQQARRCLFGNKLSAWSDWPHFQGRGSGGAVKAPQRSECTNMEEGASRSTFQCYFGLTSKQNSSIISDTEEVAWVVIKIILLITLPWERLQVWQGDCDSIAGGSWESWGLMNRTCSYYHPVVARTRVCVCVSRKKDRWRSGRT